MMVMARRKITVDTIPPPPTLRDLAVVSGQHPRPPIAEDRRCQQIKDDGEQCGSFSLKGEQFCRIHGMSLAEQEKLKEALARGRERYAERVAAGEVSRGRRRLRVEEVMEMAAEAHAARIAAVYEEALTATLVVTNRGDIVDTGMPDHQTRLRAAEMLQDRTVGKAKQRVEQEVNVGITLGELLADDPGAYTDTA